MDIAMRNAQPIRRQDLYHDGDSSVDNEGFSGAGAVGGDAAAAARAALEAIMARTLGLDFGLLTTPAAATPPEAESPDESGDVAMEETSKEAEKPASAADGGVEFAFRLFSSSGKAAAVSEPAVPTVVLYDDIVLTGDGLDTATGPGGLASAPRPLSAYVASEPTAAELARYAQTAVTGETIAAQAAAGQRNAWGLEVPWRARTTVRVSQSELRALLASALPDETKTPLPQLAAQAANKLPPWALLSTSSVASSSIPLAECVASRKRRPGKKRRIVLRQREKARLEKEAVAKLQHKSKEEHLLEKKKRLNRLKKLRRREKKREEHKAGGSQGADDGNNSDNSDGTDT
ncbi:hypothetical protein CMQ_4172 [Grosmannia clavigera kw1407]|uniref:Uncharacterized protein n=1 Tax=Grosmannia clavigera (strain kw1407 / UAMH 11150) TaxID=655863 RepID=F0X8U0_GROCL|nr:uncharacterized protein CMQ_4172 [Grosmannia clavigera kw1407]EFX06103.1 hypothetical protein CMQ_4172 [Grosmannia clavigera kw1407]